MNKNWVSEKKKTETEEKGKCDRHIAGLHAKIAPRISVPETLFITTADNHCQCELATIFNRQLTIMKDITSVLVSNTFQVMVYHLGLTDFQFCQLPASFSVAVSSRHPCKPAKMMTFVSEKSRFIDWFWKF